MRNSLILSLTALMLLCGSALLTAQESADAQTEAVEGNTSNEESADRHSPLPTYYGMLGVSDEQREKLYAVQDKYEAKLEELREQLKAVVRERDAEMETMLTPGQKLRLSELREAARKRAAEMAAEREAKAAAEDAVTSEIAP